MQLRGSRCQQPAEEGHGPGARCQVQVIDDQDTWLRQVIERVSQGHAERALIADVAGNGHPVLGVGGEVTEVLAQSPGGLVDLAGRYGLRGVPSLRDSDPGAVTVALEGVPTV